MKSALIMVVLVSLCFTGARQAGGAIINGSFEQGPSFSGDGYRVLAGSSELTGWTVTGDSIEIVVKPYWDVSEGLRAIDLSGWGRGGIKQTFTTIPGMTYQVSFDLAGNPEGGSQYKTIHVSVGSFAQNYSVNSSGQTRSTIIWHPITFWFVASGTSATLSFESQEYNAYGPLLDHVVVAPVPEPAGALMAATGLAGCAILHVCRRIRMAARHDEQGAGPALAAGQAG